MVRWPVPILAASSAVVMLGAVFVPTYKQNYDDRQYQPASASAKKGFAAADRHFPPSKLFSEMLMVETDHDMRNSADFISLDRVAKALIRLPGVAMVQSITRPLGRPLEHATIPYLFTTQGSGNGQQLPFNREQNMNTDQQADIQAHSVAVLRKEIGFFQKVSDEMHNTVLTVEDLQHVTDEINEEVSNLDDFFRPLKSYFYWDKHCFDIPICWALRSVWDTIDQIDHLAEDINKTRISLVRRSTRHSRQSSPSSKPLLTTPRPCGPSWSTLTGRRIWQTIQTEQTFDDSINVGNDFDKARSDDFFYIPHEGFRQRGRQNRYAADDVAGR